MGTNHIVIALSLVTNAQGVSGVLDTWTPQNALKHELVTAVRDIRHSNCIGISDLPRLQFRATKFTKRKL